MLSIGDVAPEFDLPDQHGRRLRLSDLRGTRTVLVFLPLAFSAVCAGELEQLSADERIFEAAGAEVVGVTVDSMFSLRAWADSVATSIRLLSDFWPHGAVCARYEAFDAARGRAKRVTVAIDGEGRVVTTFSTPADRARTTEMYVSALAEFDRSA
ncbi:redoxin domain-containing protein [Paramicrobacterium agarici]|uniref:redoxin domain-containing protein n=1 Tax=Paramicrobacterium agarici TaxID=630514 RepID=UPI00114F8C4F|nr:redoxin domain-containing protein [Microbacterium agarici]TQO24344.1 peroxiredoxin [Microbacterium agarici]